MVCIPYILSQNIFIDIEIIFDSLLIWPFAKINLKM